MALQGANSDQSPSIPMAGLNSGNQVRQTRNRRNQSYVPRRVIRACDATRRIDRAHIYAKIVRVRRAHRRSRLFGSYCAPRTIRHRSDVLIVWHTRGSVEGSQRKIRNIPRSSMREQINSRFLQKNHLLSYTLKEKFIFSDACRTIFEFYSNFQVTRKDRMKLHRKTLLKNWNVSVPELLFNKRCDS